MQRYSEFELTGNKALDTVAEAVGHAKHFKLIVKFIRLNRTWYALFMAGIEVLQKQPLPEAHHLQFDGVSILQGDLYDKNIHIEYATPKELKKARSQ